jgi:thiol-disulfide isomerase/thioredoxin
MGVLRDLARKVVGRVARRVARAELFEQPGERPPAPPLAPGASPAPPLAPAAPPPASAAPAPRPTARFASVEDIAAAQAKGPLLVNHWATWCIPCVEEFPALLELFGRYGARLPVLGVSWDLFDPRGDAEDIREHVENFAAGHGLGWPSLVVPEGTEADALFAALGLDFHQVPQTLLIDGDGRVVHQVHGALTPATAGELSAAIERLLA